RTRRLGWRGGAGAGRRPAPPRRDDDLELARGAASPPRRKLGARPGDREGARDQGVRGRHRRRPVQRPLALGVRDRLGRRPRPARHGRPLAGGRDRGARGRRLGQRPGDAAGARRRASGGVLAEAGDRDRPPPSRRLRARDRHRLPADRRPRLVTTQTTRPRFVAHGRAFHAIARESPRRVRVVETEAHEGPVYVADDDALYFTTVAMRDERGVPQVAIRRLDLDGLRFPLDPGRISTVREPANAANGMTLDHAGFLLVCEQGTFDTPARISRVDRASGAAETVVEGRGSRLNSPNDVLVRPDGTIWFTDPSYGHLQGFRPEPEAGDLVYRYHPAADELSVAADGFDKPNGPAFAPH